MRGTPSYRGSLSGLTLEGSHSIATSFSITDDSQNELFTVQPTSVTCSVDFNELSPSVCNYLKNVTSDVQDQIDSCLRPQEGTHRRYHSQRLIYTKPYHKVVYIRRCYTE